MHELSLNAVLPENPDQAPSLTHQDQPLEAPPEPATELVTIQSLLHSIPLFVEAPRAFFTQLETLLHFQNCPAGRMIIEKGRLGRSMFLILSGSVELLSEPEAPPSLILEAGDSFGYMGIIFCEPRKSYVRARQNVTLCELEKRDLDKLLEAWPEIARRRQELTRERMVMSRLKQAPASPRASEHLQALMERQKARARASLHKPEQGAPQTLYDVHILLRSAAHHRAARIVHINRVLNQLGSVLKTLPAQPEAEGSRLGFVLRTAARPEQMLEDLKAVAEVVSVEIQPVS